MSQKRHRVFGLDDLTVVRQGCLGLAPQRGDRDIGSIQSLAKYCIYLIGGKRIRRCSCEGDIQGIGCLFGLPPGVGNHHHAAWHAV